MNKDINSFEYFEEMTTNWSRLDLAKRCYDLCNEMVEKQREIERLKTELQDTKEHLGEYLHEQEEENNRLNNIINELEKWLEEEQINSVDLDEWTIIQVRDKILELKGSDKE